MAHPFYKSTKWLKKRERMLRRDEYLCQESKRYGKSETATTIHHIFPRDTYPELALVSENLVSLSDKWHNAMHDRVTNEITALGRDWQDRARPKLRDLGYTV